MQKKIKRALQNLPLLPPEKILEGYETIVKMARNKRVFSHFRLLFSYFENYWLKQVGYCNVSLRFCLCFNLLFRPFVRPSIRQNDRNTISVADLDMRTTSPMEAINSAIQRSFPRRTNIFKFIECLRLYEAQKSEDLFNIGDISNVKPKRKRAKDRIRDEKISNLTAQLNSGHISVKSFLELMSENDVALASGK